MLTEISGGTDGALSSGLPFVLAEIGRIKFDFFAAGWTGEEAKNVAETVADYIKAKQVDE